MDIEELIRRIEVERDLTIKTRDRAIAEMKTILAKAQQDGRAEMSEDEEADFNAAVARRDRARRELDGIENKLARAHVAKDAEQEVDLGLAERRGDPAAKAVTKPAYDRVARVGSEERTYHKGNSRTGGPFIRDVLLSFLYRNVESEDRLMRHMREEQVERGQYLNQQRAVGTGAFAGLTVPQYLTDLYAPAIAARRPFADVCNKHPLPPDGMTVNISRITTSSSAALQASENASVSETNMDDTLLTENVQTAAGSQTVSRQAIDRGTGVEETIMDDLMRRYGTALDSTLINQATTGLTNISTTNTYDDSTPTVPEMWPKILGAAAGSEAALLGFANPDFVVMHSRRWYWMQAQLTTSWPFVTQPGIPTQAGGVNLAETYGRGARGLLPNGMVVIVDNNIATNLGTATSQDEIYVVPSDECHLWEDPDAPVFIRAEQTNAKTLGVDLVVYGYFAYTFRRFSNSHQKIAGTGLTTPSF